MFERPYLKYQSYTNLKYNTISDFISSGFGNNRKSLKYYLVERAELSMVLLKPSYKYTPYE